MSEDRMDKKLTGHYLLLDAAGPLVQTGIWKEGQWVRWQGSREEAGRSLFEGAGALFHDLNLSLADLSGFFFCEGPGSMLGIRMAAMAIRGWQSLLDAPLPVFTYNSHELLARALLAARTLVPFNVISDARRNRWNLVSVPQTDLIGPLQRVPAGDLNDLTGPVFRMEETIRNETPIRAELVPYILDQHAGLFMQPGLLRQATTPDALIQETPEYQKWNADRHR